MPDMSPAAGSALPVGARDPRLDFFRGLSLLMIYINHVPGTVYENFTSRNFGLSDAAEGFVFMSGCAAALAYGPKMKHGLNWASVRKGWGRSWTLYLTHMFTTIWAIAIVSGAALWFGSSVMLEQQGYQVMGSDPLAFMIGIASLGHQLGYVNILPMYAVLMLGAPFLIRLGQRSPIGLLAASVGFWAFTGMTHFDLPNFPQEGGWFFNPFAWQMIFSFGILTGLALRHGRRFAPLKGWLIWVAAIWVAFCLVWVKSETIKTGIGEYVRHLRDLGAPFFLVEFDKTYVSLPRFAHFIALAYLLSLPWGVPRFAASKAMAPVRLLGRHGLQVFAASTVLAIFSQAVKQVHPAGFGQDSVLILGGLALLWAFAWIRDRIRQSDKAIAAAQHARHAAPHAPRAAGAAATTEGKPHFAAAAR